MPIRIGLCLVFSLYNNFTDWKDFRIRNRAVVLFAALGLMANVICSGGRGLLGALAGCGIMLCLLPLFALRMLGAGDIKALMSIGCMLGFPAAPQALAYSLLGAGVAAVLTVLFRKNGKMRLRRLFAYLKFCWISKTILPYAEKLDHQDGGFRFSFGITAGLLALLGETLLK